jgi:capsular polysaccharide biosynthesis protein
MSPTLLALADRLLADAPAARRAVKLYVTRRKGVARSIINHEEVEAFVRSRGYEIVDPGTLPLREQIALFRGAIVVLGPLGAGLTNTLFMPPGSRVGMLDPGSCDPGFWELACLKGQQFTWIFTREVTPFEHARHNSPFPVDIEALRPALDWFESDRPGP